MTPATELNTNTETMMPDEMQRQGGGVVIVVVEVEEEYYYFYSYSSSKDGIALINNAIYSFIQCPLEGADKISSLQSKDTHKLHGTVLHLATQFGYDDFMIKKTLTTCVVTPGANNSRDPPVIAFKNPINLLETYAVNNIDHCRRNATIIWSDLAFVEQNPQVLCPLSIALLGEITNHNPPWLTNIGKEVVMHDHI